MNADLSGRIDQTNGRLHQINANLDGRIEQTNIRIDQTNAGLAALREELSRRVVESGIRTATAITDLAGIVRDIATLLRAEHDPRPGLERCENDIAELQRRLAVPPVPAQERL
jgi:hypothetical protein